MILLFLIWSSILICGYQLNSTVEDAGAEDKFRSGSTFFAQRDWDDREKISFHSYRLNKENIDFTNETDKRISFLDRATTLSMHLRQMANTELGVTSLQDTLNALNYVTVKKDEEKELSKMIQTLDDKLKMYSSLLEEMSAIVRVSYRKYKLENIKSNRESSGNLILDFSVGSDLVKKVNQHEYYPCCIIPDHYLVFDPHFGTSVNVDLWCDSGLEQDKLTSEQILFFTPQKLTEVFSVNRHIYPNLKWQFFMSSSGVHTEYPAHRSGTSVGSECGQSSRHHHIYEKTIRPRGRNIILLFDLGHTMQPRLLLTLKAVGHYILDTLTHKDNIAMLGIADSVILPSASCLNSLLAATHDVKQSLRHFVDYLEIIDAPTNHSLGLEAALNIVSSWSQGRVHRQSILVIYVTRGILGDLDEVEQVVRVTARKVDEISARIIISAFGLGIPQSCSFFGPCRSVTLAWTKEDEPSLQTQFLDTLTSQNYARFGINVKKRVHRGEVIPVSTTLRVAPILRNFYDVVEPPNKNHNVTISDPYWDEQGNGMVITLSRGVYDEDEQIIGVVGIDLSLAHFLEDAAHYFLQDNSYAFVIDCKGNTLSHPKIGRPEVWSQPLLPSPATALETSSSFRHLAPHILLLPSGRKRSKRNLKEEREYWWRRSETFGWIFILSVPSLKIPLKILSSDTSPLPSHAIYHRLDLLSPQEAKVCRHFNQMGTLDSSSIFISSGAFQSPSTYLAKGFRNPSTDSSVMAYLMDTSMLLSNPGLKVGVRESASAFFHISSLWQALQKESKLQKYIVRRYGATFQGVTLMHPGTLMDASYDPKSQEWFIKAIENPGNVVVSPPFLDPGGGGQIVTVSHTVYEGRSATLHSPEDPVQAVLAADFTLGYWHKLLVDIEPLCAKSIYFKELNQTNNEVSSIRCFLMDMSGYLIAHPSFVNPSSLRHVDNTPPKHITHQEPVLSMALLGKSITSQSPSEPLLQKMWCANYWKGSSDRHYLFTLKAGQVVQSGESSSKQLKLENSCLQYKLAAVPASNLIFGIINQTCTPATAFCPCSMVDRLCLNCQLMESAACECPCECPLPSEPCIIRNLSTFGSSLEENPSKRAWQNGEWPEAFVSCPRAVESPGPLHYGVGMLSQLDVCVPMPCDTHASIHSCLGVIDCVWCVLESDGTTPLDYPYCTQSHNCYGGIRGGPSPYPPGLSPLPHSKERGSSLPIGPVAGGVLAVFVVMGLAIYFYRSYVGVNSSTISYTSSTQRSQNHCTPLYPHEIYPEIETGENESLDDGIITASAAAAISPYRMNPGYRRPVGNHGESSDHGYSTMTPHDESENLTYTDLAASSLFPSSSGTHGWPSSDSELSHQYSTSSYQTRLSSPKKIGPNKVIVPVTVHMVDSV